ncbi:HEPN domain-containing protein [Streptomyces sp. NPDC086838]|uniref:ApeA N-terminal domain 1-containing protein n=1 Tax=Streptomyces sp. NPDC086838 TaxID=3365762 RepID=UPI0037FBD133
MEAFESDGLFWLPGDEENQVAGRISFAPLTGAFLHLIGSFSDDDFGDDEKPTPEIVVGVAGKRYLTLTGCSLKNRKFESPGFLREVYRVSFLFAGHRMVDSHNPMFERVSLRFNNLYAWAGRNSVSRQVVFGEDRKKLIKATLTLEPSEVEKADCGAYEVALTGTWKILGNEKSPGFDQDCSLRVSYGAPVDFETVTGDLAILQDLITATSDAATIPTEVTLYVAEGEEENSRQSREGVKLYGQQMSYSRAKEKKIGDMPLSLPAIGGLSAVAGWMSFMRDRRVLTGLLLSPVYSSMYVENQFFNRVSAAETLHRMEFSNELRPAEEYKNFRRMLVRHVPKKYKSWLSQQIVYSNEPRLRDRLGELAEFVNMSDLLGCDARRWAKAVTDARNRMVHHDKGKGEGASTTELFWLGESLKIVVLAALAKFSNFAESAQRELSEADDVRFLAERLREIVEPEIA